MAQLINIQVRRDTAANWTSVNPILGIGEIGFETITNQFKIGDGSSVWTALTYYFTRTGVALGAASLDSTGKVPVAQLPASVIGGLNYQSAFNSNTGISAATSAAITAGNKGYYWKVATAGSLPSATSGTTGTAVAIYWNIGDLIVDNGASFDKIDGIGSEVLTVAGRTGAVALAASDVSGLATSATTDTTNAANIGSGTLVVARLPALTGDATSTAGTGALVLAASGATAGTYANATVTVDAKGRVTSATAGTAATSINGGTA